MLTLHQPPVKTAAQAPYWRRRIALYRWVYAHAAPERGLPPVPWPLP
jgi:hypothetical protein